MQKPKRERPRFSLFALILIALGVILLLQNLGALPWGLWGSLWRFWPVVLILIGLNILLGRRSPWLALALSLAVLLGTIGAAVLTESSRPAGGTAPFSQALQGITGAEVEIDFGAGELVIGSLPADSPSLVEGSSNPKVQQDFRVRGSTGILHLSVPSRIWGWLPGEKGLQLQTSLSRNIPLELVVKTGASNARLDLTDLKVSRLRVEAGASQLALSLPAMAGTTEAVVKAGVARVAITIPKGVAARIKAETGLASLNVDTARFPRVGDIYESPDFATAGNRVYLDVEGGVASVDIR